MRISLKCLLGILTFSSVLAWSAARAGFDNVPFWCLVVVQALLAIGFIRLARDEKRRRFTPLIGVPALMCALPTASLTVVVNGILLMIAGAISATRPPWRTERLFATTLLCAALSLLAGAVPRFIESHRLEVMQQEFPIVSLVDRLQYEQGKLDDNNVPLDGEVVATLATLESTLDSWNRRERQLKMIHSEAYERFVRSPGFGVVRMARPTAASLRQPPLRDIPFNGEPASGETGAYPDFAELHRSGVVNSKPVDDLEFLHRVGLADFLDASSFGATFDRLRRIAGFAPHAFRYSPRLGFADSDHRDAWTIERLELVSLIKFDEPRVYVLDHLPRMDQLSSDAVPTRALDAFEAASLAELALDRDIVVSQQGTTYRMLGSLRAARRCLDCHSAPRGALLGAFSYALKRTDPVDRLN